MLWAICRICFLLCSRGLAGSGFSASPVASDGKIYLPSEDGDIFVVSAGERFELLKTNPMNDPVMATPAISSGTLIVRTQHRLYGIRHR